MRTLLHNSISKNLLFTGLLLAALAVPAAARANEAVYQKLLPATVWVRVPGVSTGSGVLVDPNRRWILTNYHVVEQNNKVRIYFPAYKNGELVMERSYYLDNDSSLGIDGRVIARTTTKDLALIQIEQVPQGARPVKLAATSPRPGQALHVVANEGGTDSLWTYTPGTVRSVIRERFSLRIPGTSRTVKLDARVVVTSLATNAGDSGGPVVNDKAELVALVSSGRTDKRLVSECIDVTEIRAFLNQMAGSGTQVVQGPSFNGISGIQPPSSTAPAKPQPPAQNFSIVGSWQGQLALQTGATATFTVTLDNAGRFTFGVNRTDGVRFSKLGTYQMNGDRLVMNADGKLLVSGRVIWSNANSFTLDDGKDRTVFTRTGAGSNPPPPANPQPPVKSNPQPPAQDFAIVGVWTGRIDRVNGGHADIGLALSKNGSFGFSARRNDGVQLKKTGEWKLQNGRLVLTTDGQLFIAGKVIPNGADSFTLDDGKDRIVFTRMNIPQPPNPAGANPAPAAPQQVNLAGSTWTGTENLQGFGRLSFQFQAGGQVNMTDASGVSQGTWIQQGNQVTLTFANGQLTYRGIINGQVMSGNAGNVRGASWTFSLRRQ